MQRENVTLGADERLDPINEELRLIQKKQGLTFGTDALLLAAAVTADSRALCVELGSGTGVVSLLLARRSKVARVLGVEIQQGFAELMARNAAINGLDARVQAVCEDARSMTQTRLGELLGEKGAVTADVVVCNPPYMRTDSGARNEADEKYIARHEVCGDVGDFCAAAARLLRYGGRFYVVYRPDRLVDLMAALRQYRLEPKRVTMVHADEQTPPCMVLIEARAGGAAGLTVTPPLMLHPSESRTQAHRPLTEQAQAVYDRMSFDLLGG